MSNRPNRLHLRWLAATTLIAMVVLPDVAQATPDDGTPSEPADQVDTDEEGGRSGIGIAPAFVTIEGALRGNEYTETLILLNNTDGDRRFILTPEGDNTDWVSFRDPDGNPIDEIDIPHQGSIPLDIIIAIPADVANGTYQTSVDVAGIPTDLANVDSSDALVSIGALVPVTVEVGGEMRQSATFDGVVVGRAEVGQPVEIAASFNNTGNVGFAPTVEFAISRNDQRVANLVLDGGDTVPPGRAEDLVTVWDTTDTLPGDYVVTAAATADGYVFEQRSAEFRIDPAGTVERSGELVGFELVNLPLVGSIARVRAEFRNTSDVPVNAVLVADVELDGTLVGEVRSLDVLARANDVTTLDATIDGLESGTYVVRGKINYEGRETTTLETTFDLTAEAAISDAAAVDVGDDDGDGPNRLMIGLFAGVVALGLVAVLLLRRRRVDTDPAVTEGGTTPPSAPMEVPGRLNGDDVLARQGEQQR